MTVATPADFRAFAQAFADAASAHETMERLAAQLRDALEERDAALANDLADEGRIEAAEAELGRLGEALRQAQAAAVALAAAEAQEDVGQKAALDAALAENLRDDAEIARLRALVEAKPPTTPAPAPASTVPWVVIPSVPNVRLPAEILVPVGTKGFSLLAWVDGPITSSISVRPNTKNVSGGNVNTGDSGAQRSYWPNGNRHALWWRIGDDADLWIGHTMPAGAGVAGRFYEVGLSARGAKSPGTSARVTCSAQVTQPMMRRVAGGLLEPMVPPAVMPFHRAPLRLVKTGAPAATLDPATFVSSGTGFVGNRKRGDPGALPCFTESLPHANALGAVQGNAAENGYYPVNAHPIAAGEMAKVVTLPDGRQAVRLRSCKLPAPYFDSLTGKTFFWRSSAINTETLTAWASRTGMWTSTHMVARGARMWSAFWSIALDFANLSGIWPFEIDVSEEFNLVYGGPAEWPLDGTTTSSALHFGNVGGNWRSSTGPDKGVRGIHTDLKEVGLAVGPAWNQQDQGIEQSVVVTEDPSGDISKNLVTFFRGGYETWQCRNLAIHQDPTNQRHGRCWIWDVAVAVPSDQQETFVSPEGAGDMHILGAAHYAPGTFEMVPNTAPMPWGPVLQTAA